MRRAIAIDLAPNYQADDVRLALALLVQPRRWVPGDAPTRLAQAVQQLLPGRMVLPFGSARAALWALLRSFAWPAGDEVLLQAFTCVAVPAAVRWAGLRPVFVDIAPRTFNLDPADLAAKITTRSRAVIVQHTFGYPAALDDIRLVAAQSGLALVEDCAHALGATYRGQPLGTLGDAAVFSFGRDKALSGVFGGLAATPQSEVAARLHAFLAQQTQPAPRDWVARQLLQPVVTSAARATLHRLGFGRALLRVARRLGMLSLAVEPAEYRGRPPSFQSYQMPNALAELALHQWQKLEQFTRHRQTLAATYRQRLQGQGGVQLPVAVAQAAPAPIRFPLTCRDPARVLQAASRVGVHLGEWYRPVIAPPGVAALDLGYLPGSCPRAEAAATGVVNLPTHIGVNQRDAERIAALVAAAVARRPMSGWTNRQPGTSGQAPPLVNGGQGRGLHVAAVATREAWDACLARLRPPTFLQSWAWGEFNRRQGNEVFRLGLFPAGGTGDPVGLALVVLITARRARFLFCPHGPVIASPFASAALVALVAYLQPLARRCGASFLRISSQFPDAPESVRLFSRLRFRPAPIHMHPELAWLLDLTPDVGSLLAGMRKTMRHLIRKSQRLGMTVRSGATPADAATFLALYRSTAQRQHFVAFSEGYVRDELAAFGADAQIFLAEHLGKVLAGAVIVFAGSSAFYHHGASLTPNNNLPAAYLLHWEVIRAAKRRGCRWYNFWGIAPPHRLGHPWAGLTAFKQGFGGHSEAYLPAQDYPLAARYWLNYVVERFRRVRRGF